MMKKIIYSILAVTFVLSINSCETTELDLLADPQQVGQDQLDPQFLFNTVQLTFAQFVQASSGYSTFSSEVTRQFTMQGSSVYAGAYSPNTFNGIWSFAYANVLQDIAVLENLENPESYEYHLGVSKVLKAYILFTLVDFFGDVPLTEALQGASIEEPSYDDQVSVYNAAFAELDAARVLLASGRGIEPLEDFYFGVDGSSLAKWITVANSLELRALNNARDAGSDLGIDIVSRITSLLNEDNLIDSESEDFQFNYVANRVNPDSRHPAYSANYEVTAAGYIANYLMWEMVAEKGFDDPRTRYYFYRQDTDATNEDIFTLGCTTQSAPGHYNSLASIFDSNIPMPFCTADLGRGYWGRDHGDDNGIPPDVDKRTVWGAYPAGGLFDANQDDDVQNDGTDGLLGAGIEPILLSTHVAFIKAEIAEELGIGNAAQSLEDAIRFSMDKVLNFGSLDPATVIVADNPDTAENEEVLQGSFFPDASDVDDYVAFVLDAYNNSSNKLDIIMKEHHIASFGNGLEVYNAYRRTGLPSNMQPSLNPNPGGFYRAAFYPANSVNNNTSASQADITRQIFWDKNPAGFIN